MSNIPLSPERVKELLPCPFCGTQPPHAWPLMKMDGTWCTHYMHCGRCGINGPETRSQSEAVAAWNRRATQPRAESEGVSAERLDSVTLALNCVSKPTMHEHDTVHAALLLIEDMRRELQRLRARAPEEVAEYDDGGSAGADTGNQEADRILNRLASSDPSFDDCVSACVLIRRLVADARGPDGFATWKDAALHERMLRLSPPPSTTRRECETCGDSGRIDLDTMGDDCPDCTRPHTEVGE